MDRDMSYELDGVFAQRNAGELVKVVQTKTRVMRAPGLAASNVHATNRGLGRRVPGPTTQRLNPPMATAIAHEHVSPMQRATRPTQVIPTEHVVPATGLADAYVPMDGLGLTIPGLGTISWAQLGIGAAIGVGISLLLRRRKH